MKKVTIIIAIFLFWFNISVIAQQNLVPNGDFEYYSTCPTTTSQISNCTGWSFFTAGTSDFFNTCYTASNFMVGIPFNFSGYQPAVSGNGYAGGYSIGLGVTPYKEYITRPITPMQKGLPYEVSMSVSLSNLSNGATNDMAMFFYDASPTYYNTSSIPAVTPQVEWTNMIVTDTQNWVRLSKIFVADSAYDNIAIGGFRNANNINILGTASVVYYYIDSVVVRLHDSMSVNFNDSSLCAGDTIVIPYYSSLKKQPNNVFTIQLSNASGSFATPVNIGTKTTDSSGSITIIIPANTPTGAGYRIRLIASNPADTSNDNGFNIKIGNAASAAITTGSNTPLCSGGNINLSAGSNFSGTTYTWTGPNSFSSSVASPIIASATTTQSGNYYVTVKVYGCEVKDTLTVVVKPLPAKPITNSNTPICAGETLNLTAASITNGVTYSWTGPGSFATTTQNPNITSTTTGMSGDYIVAAILNGCQLTDTATVLVKPMPTTVTAGSNSPICAASSLQLTTTNSTTGSTYAWTGPNSFTANTQNTNVSNSTAAATGWYVATVDLNGCKIKDSVNATVYPIPATPTASYSNPLCVGQTLNLAATTVAGATYSWTGPNNYTSNTQNPTRSNMQFGDTGLYNVTSTVNGCTSPAGSVRININALPFVVIFPTPGDTICVGDNVKFTALPNNHGGVPQYQWYINNTPVSSTGSTFSSTQLANSDVVRCNMTENTKCNGAYTDESNDVNMKVLPWLAPSVTFTANPNRPLEVDEFVTFTATPANAGASPTYQWKRNGQNVQGATGSVWSANTLNDNDSISVEVISSYKCPQPLKGFANGVRVKILSGVGDVNNIKGLTVYPNPNNGRFVVSGNLEANDEVTIALYNTIGQNVYTKAFTPINKTLSHEVSLPEIAAGIYMVKITQLGQTAVSRFVVD